MRRSRQLVDRMQAGVNNALLDHVELPSVQKIQNATEPSAHNGEIRNLDVVEHAPLQEVLSDSASCYPSVVKLDAARV